MSRTIPKTVHYCWFGGAEMSALHQACIASWKKELPDYRFICWDETNSPMELPFVSYHYNQKNWAYVSDFIRLYVLYHHGGIYLDTDVEVIRDFEPLLSYRVFLGYEQEKRLNSAVLGAQKEEAFMLACMEYMQIRHKQKRPYRIAPEVITAVYQGGEFYELTTLPQHTFYPYNPYDKKGIGQLLYHDITKETFAIHHWAKSWKMSLIKRLMRKIL